MRKRSVCPGFYKFTGKERDAESGLDYFGARYLRKQYGEVHVAQTAATSSMHRLADPQQLNLYMYGKNNPLSITDPTGLDITAGEHAAPTTSAVYRRTSRASKIDYDKNGKVETVGDVDRRAFQRAIKPS